MPKTYRSSPPLRYRIWNELIQSRNRSLRPSLFQEFFKKSVLKREHLSLRPRRRLMIVAHEVQDTMENHVTQFLSHEKAMLSRLTRDHRGTNGDFSEALRIVTFKTKDVGRTILSSKFQIQGLHFSFSDKSDDELATAKPPSPDSSRQKAIQSDNPSPQKRSRDRHAGTINDLNLNRAIHFFDPGPGITLAGAAAVAPAAAC